MQMSPSPSGGLFGIPEQHVMLVILIGLPIAGGLFIGLAAVILDFLKKVRLGEAENRLKEAMIAQGRPTEEIERVVKASAYGKKLAE